MMADQSPQLRPKGRFGRWKICTDHLNQAILRDAGLETGNPEQFNSALERYRPLRCKLTWLCLEDGWGEPE